MINLLELIPRCHEAAKAKGFWDKPRNEGEVLMLCVGELSKCLDAHRTGRICRLSKDSYDGLLVEAEENRWTFKRHFEVWCKDSVSDELADAYIRLCDFAGGFGIDQQELDNYINVIRPFEQFEVHKTFGESLFAITEYIVAMAIPSLRISKFTMESLVNALFEINALAVREGIDLAMHIDLKLRYNASRPKLHGKAY